MEKTREKFGSRLGFILISAGCAIGLGNVWRFPYIVGQYGGAAFILLYLLFLVIFGLPIMTMEFSVGRASQRSIATSFKTLEPKGTKWHHFGWVGICGNYLLMMFYTTVAGWMIAYFVKTLGGEFVGLTQAGISQAYDTFTQNAVEQVLYMVIATLLGFGVCALGLKGGVEKITKVMMILLLAIIAILAVHSITLPGAGEGLAYYLIPDFSKMVENGLGSAIFAALGQAFFTLSIGIGSMAVFGSYIKRDRALFGESVSIAILDTSVAFVAGLIIIPACFSFGINPDAGPRLIFETLPNVFNHMGGGQIWGSLFFLFMTFAAISTVIAVFENLISMGMDKWGWSRKKAVLINLGLMLVLALPCCLGTNLLSGIQPLGAGSTIMDLEDFIISNNLLPLGSLVYVLFCTSNKYGWGWNNFLLEANAGKGLKIPDKIRIYAKYVMPVVIIVLWAYGYVEKFFL